MVSIAVIAGLLAAIFWGITPVMAKRGLSYGGGPFSATLIVISTGLVILWSSLGIVEGNFFPDISGSAYGVFLISGVVGTAIGRITSYFGIDRVGASVNSAVVATNPLFATILAVVFLQEFITGVQAIGIVVTITGLSVLAFSRGGDIAGWNKRSLLFSLTAALAFGSGAVIRRFGLTVTDATALEGVAINEVAAFLVLGGYVLGRRATLKIPPLKGGYYFIAAGVFNTIALLSLFIGLDYGRVAIVATVSGTSTLFSTLFTFVLLRDLERITKGVILGAMAVVLGISLITLF